MTEHVCECGLICDSIATTIDDARDRDLSLVAVNVVLLEKVLEKLSEYETLKKATEKLRVALLVVLDATDYTAHGCGVTEMVGAVLPKELIVMAREAIAYADILETT